MSKHQQKHKELSENIEYTGIKQVPTNITMFQYSGNLFFETNIESISAINDILLPECVNWIKVTGFTDAESIITLVKAFGLTKLDAQDILTPQRIIKLEESENGIFFILKYICLNHENELVKDHLGFILQGDTLISFQESDFDIFSPVINAIKENKFKLRERGADYLLIWLLNSVLSKSTEYAVQIEDELEDLEDRVIDFTSSDDLLPEIQKKRKEYLVLRKVILPLKEQVAKLSRNEFHQISDEILPFASDLYDRLLYSIQVVESIKETLLSVLDLYVNNNDTKRNDIMKRLTVVSTIFIPLTFLVGVWGMNFNFMPELGWKHGYFVAWIIILLVGIGVWMYFRKKKWF